MKFISLTYSLDSGKPVAMLINPEHICTATINMNSVKITMLGGQEFTLLGKVGLELMTLLNKNVPEENSIDVTKE